MSAQHEHRQPKQLIRSKSTRHQRHWTGRWGRWITLALTLVTAVLVAPSWLLMESHANADSEVGVMVHGMMVIMTLMALTPTIAISLFVWMVGLYFDRLVSTAVPWWEYLICLIYLGGIGLIGIPTIARLIT